MIFGGTSVLWKIKTALVGLLIIYCIVVSFLYFPITGTGDVDTSNTGADLSAEIDGIRKSIQSIDRNQSATLVLVREQGRITEQILGKTESIASGITRSEDLVSGSTELLESVRDQERGDRVLLSENREILEAGRRIVGSLREEDR